MAADPAGPATRPEQQQAFMQALTTEHFTLQTARAVAVSEGNGRTALYIGALSSTLVALALVAQRSPLGHLFHVVALTVGPAVFVLGLVTYVRVLQSSVEDILYARAINRIRHYYTEIDPTKAHYFLLSGRDDVGGALANMCLRDSWTQFLFTLPSAAAGHGAVGDGVRHHGPGAAPRLSGAPVRQPEGERRGGLPLSATASGTGSDRRVAPGLPVGGQGPVDQGLGRAQVAGRVEGRLDPGRAGRPGRPPPPRPWAGPRSRPGWPASAPGRPPGPPAAPATRRRPTRPAAAGRAGAPIRRASRRRPARAPGPWPPGRSRPGRARGRRRRPRPRRRPGCACGAWPRTRPGPGRHPRGPRRPRSGRAGRRRGPAWPAPRRRPPGPRPGRPAAPGRHARGRSARPGPARRPAGRARPGHGRRTRPGSRRPRRAAPPARPGPPGRAAAGSRPGRPASRPP